jgi:ribosomal protein S21
VNFVGEKRRKNESFEAFMRRVKKRWQQSGRLNEAKKRKFHERQPNRTQRKKTALHRLHKQQEIEYLKKIGRYPEETNLLTRVK